jgi:predicted nucleic acid-binding protein
MILIDTNVYSAANLSSAVAISTLKQSDLIYVPTIVIAELRAGFLGGSKQDYNDMILDKFLSDKRVEVANVTLATTIIYAELADYAKKRGRSLSHNDLWIAALAKENGLKLVTFDRDFEVFADILGDKLLVLY